MIHTCHPPSPLFLITPFSRIFKEFGVSTGRDKRPVAERRRKMRIGKTEKFAVIRGCFFKHPHRQLHFDNENPRVHQNTPSSSGKKPVFSVIFSNSIAKVSNPHKCLYCYKPYIIMEKRDSGKPNSTAISPLSPLFCFPLVFFHHPFSNEH